jgi:hypothetical protein
LCRALTALNFVSDVELRLSQIVQRRAFQVSAPDVFDRVAKVKTHVPGNLDALDAARVLRVMRRVID